MVARRRTLTCTTTPPPPQPPHHRCPSPPPTASSARGRDDQVRRQRALRRALLRPAARPGLHALLLDVKGKLVEKTHEVTLHTEDMEDSICAVRSMADFGLPLADDMIKDINKSLQIMSKAQPKRGLIRNPVGGSNQGKTREHGMNWVRPMEVAAGTTFRPCSSVPSKRHPASGGHSPILQQKMTVVTIQHHLQAQNHHELVDKEHPRPQIQKGTSSPFQAGCRMVQPLLTRACLLLISPKRWRLTISSKKNKN